MHKYTWLILLALSCLSLQAQENTDIYFDNGCNYANDDHGGLVTVLTTTDRAEDIVAEILAAVPEYAGEERNFVLRVANVANARAAMKNGQRYILFNINFLMEFEASSLTRWGAYSLFAHEVAHHVLEHDLASDDLQQRKRWELEADKFSGRVLARLGATRSEALAGIRNFGLSGETETHPAPSAREQAIGLAYFEEKAAMSSSQLVPEPEPGRLDGQVIQPIPRRGREKINLPLDPNTLKGNRWNLVQSAEAEIDLEKITVNFRVPLAFRNRPLRVCLLSNNSDVAPEVRLPGTISGTGSNVQLDNGTGEIVWNYDMEDYAKTEVSADDLLRVMVYSEYDLPRPPTAWGWIGSVGTMAVGTGGIVYGITEMNKAQTIYQVYEEVRDPDDAIYVDEKRQERYDRANKHHLRGQYLVWGGGIVLAGGTLWLVDKIRQRDSYRRDLCLLGKHWEWEPILAQTTGTGTELGLRVWF